MPGAKKVTLNNLYPNHESFVYIPSKDIDYEDKIIFPHNCCQEETYFYNNPQHPRPRFYNNYCRFREKQKFKKKNKLYYVKNQISR